MSTDARPTALISGTERRAIVRDCLAMVSGSNLGTLCGAVASLVMRRAVDPPLMGIWATIRVLVEYGGYSSLGLNRSAARDIAIVAGGPDRTAGAHIANVAMTWELVAGAAVAVALIVAGVWHAARGSWSWAVALWLAAGIALVGRYHAFSLAVLRSQKKFPVLAKARVAGALADLAFLAGGAYCFGFYGLVFGALACQLWNAGFVQMTGQLRFAAQLDRALAWRMVRTGWPIAAEALALAALRSIDRLVIVHYLPNGEERLGLYSVAMLLAAWGFDQSNLIANVIYPRLAETMGRTSNPAAVLGMALRAAERMALVLVPCCLLLLAVGIPALGWLLPKYRAGLVAASGLVAGSALLGASMPLRYGLITVGRTFSMLAVTGLSAGVCLAGGIWQVRAGGDLSHIAWNSAAADALCFVSLLALCGGGRRATWPSMARAVAGGAILLAGAVLVRRPLETSPLAWLVVAFASILPLCTLAREIDWRAALPSGAEKYGSLE